MGYDIFETAPQLMEAFTAANAATEPLEKSFDVAVTPSQLFNGGKMPATAENAAAIKFNV